MGTQSDQHVARIPRTDADRAWALRHADAISALRTKGFTASAIARELGVSVSARKVYRAIWLLRRLGRTVPRAQRQGRPPGAARLDLREPRLAAIVSMLRGGASLRAIGKRLGLTREYVRQLRNIIEATHGSTVLGIPTGALTVRQLAARVGLSQEGVRQYRRSGVIRGVRCGGRGMYFFAPRVVADLRQAIAARTARVCAVCGKAFVLPYRRGGWNRRICSLACERVRNRRAYLRFLHSTPSVQRQWGWHARLRQSLALRQRPPQEEWIGPAEAARRCGVSRFVLWVLRKRGVLKTTHAHPTKRSRTGGRTVLYAASEIAVVREVRQPVRSSRSL